MLTIFCSSYFLNLQSDCSSLKVSINTSISLKVVMRLGCYTVQVILVVACKILWPVSEVLSSLSCWNLQFLGGKLLKLTYNRFDMSYITMHSIRNLLNSRLAVDIINMYLNLSEFRSSCHHCMHLEATFFYYLLSILNIWFSFSFFS